MEAPVFTQDNLLFTVHSPLGQDKLLFKHLHGEEQLSGLFHFQLELLSQSRRINFQEILGQSLTVQIQFAPDYTRYLNGIVTRFAQADTDSRFTTYYADIRPWLWQLTLTQNCRIFQNLSVPDIIKKVFTDLGFHDYRFSLVRPNYYQPRVYCVQYQETAFNFVSRLMEDVGIFYFFEHHDDRHVLVLIDDLSGHPDCPEMSTARFWPRRNDTHPEDVVTHCQWQQQLTTGRYAIDDFNFEIPNANLQSSIDALPEQHSTNLRVYEYHAGFSKLTEGQDKVTRRIESQVTEHQLLEGQSYCLSFVSGHCFTLKEHRRDDFNIKYVLRWISHSLSLTHYQNDFIAFPADLHFRTPRTTPRPRIISHQTALVTGPAGEEIWTDQYGRIKVQFHWDQEGQSDENSSCWIRVNQGWAGKGWGHFTLPRIGPEVIVSFFEGDPDRPLVIGGVYNGLQPVPYSLPAEQTKSTLKSHSSKGGAGFNEFRFEDKKGEEEIYLHGQQDWNTVIENNRTHQVGHDEMMTVAQARTRTVHHDETITVDNDRTRTVHHDETITVDNDRTRTVHHDDKVTIDNDQVQVVHHDETLIINHDRVKQVDNNQTEVVGNNQTITVGQDQTETIGGSLKLRIDHHKNEVISKTATETVGLAKALTVGAGYQVTVGAAMNETVLGLKMVEVGIAKTETVLAGSHSTSAQKIYLEATEEIIIQCGSGSIKFDASGNITIEGPLVKINS